MPSIYTVPHLILCVYLSLLNTHRATPLQLIHPSLCRLRV